MRSIATIARLSKIRARLGARQLESMPTCLPEADEEGRVPKPTWAAARIWSLEHADSTTALQDTTLHARCPAAAQRQLQRRPTVAKSPPVSAHCRHLCLLAQRSKATPTSDGDGDELRARPPFGC